MIVAANCYDEMINATARSIKARVELYDGSTLLDTYRYDGALQSFTVERVGDANKFFGYGICQKLTVKLRDRERAIHITKGQGMEVVVGVGCEYLYTCPIFFVEEIKRDENTNDLTITAYDAIYRAAGHTVSEMVVPVPYTIRAFANVAAAVLGMPVKIEGDSTLFDVSYPNGANFEGKETLREALDDIAEATGTIYYMNNNWELTFKKLAHSNSVLLIDKSKYYTLSSESEFNLETIVNVTELGDNVSSSTGKTGETQYIRENPFLNIREDVDTLLNNLRDVVCGLSINQFDCKWRGNFLLEIGDRISLVTKDDSVIHTYVLNDTITYSGGLIGRTQWKYETHQNETPSTPSTLGDALRQTYARVDKVNQQIDLVVSEVTENSSAISSLKLTTDGLSTTVAETASGLNAAMQGVNDEIIELSKSVNASITSEDVQIQIETAMSDGINAVTTTTGFTFNEEGMRVARSNSPMSTVIDEDGMTVYRDNTEVLICDNEGVSARNLHSSTYLVIGEHSRFENYGDNRTGCFWVSRGGY